MKLCIITMIVRVEKMNHVLTEKGQKDKFLWALIDKWGHTIIQVYSPEYPKEMEKLIAQENYGNR